MKIAVIGAGTIGVTTAYELARDGHEVTVLERRQTAAEEGSFAIAGLMGPGHAISWGTPSMAVTAVRHLLKRHTPTRLGRSLDFNQLRWLWRDWRATRPESFSKNLEQLLALGRYSQQRQHAIIEELKPEFDRSAGYLTLLREERDRDQVASSLAVLRELGVPWRELTPDEARKLEPALNSQTRLYQAIHFPDDEIGNCRQFVLLLKTEAQKLGVKFCFNSTIEQIDTSDGLRLKMAGAMPAGRFDGIVLCTGAGTPDLARPLGLKIPLASVHGYSVSAALREPLDAPRSGVMDQRYKVAISRLGQRVRIAGISEIGTPPDQIQDQAIQTLYQVLQDWFPGAAKLSSGVQVWKGARPTLPDGLPLLGTSGIPGVWLNLGHGDHGWSLSCGSARAVADLISGKRPDIAIRQTVVQELTP